MSNGSTLEIVSVVGARPQFVKLAPVSRAFEHVGCINHSVIHTGQHYDDRMSAVFFDELDLPRPQFDLGVGSASHGAQTGAMLAKLEDCFLKRPPDAVVVYGDTNSTLAAALAATKIHVPVVHIEAGLRSFNRSMPEEINRVATDHICDRLYSPTPTGMQNLANENLDSRALLSGDVMRDVVMHNIELARERSRIMQTLDVGKHQFGLLTLHRPINTTPDALQELMILLDDMARQHVELLFPVHPRTRAILNEKHFIVPSSIRMIEPLAYLDMLQVVEAARVVVTDSGGLQKEAAYLRTLCITVRDETEWTETVEMGVNTLTGRDADNIQAAFSAAMINTDRFSDLVMNEMKVQFGNGDAAELIARDLTSWLMTHSAFPVE